MKLNYPQELPITAHREQIVAAIRDNEVVVIVGETGSGKSTQIPKMMLEAMLEFTKTVPEDTSLKVACTQPRRIAATTIAARIAEECEVSLGKEVGYKIRFDDDTTQGTIINICTDGIILQEMKGDMMLSEYDAILVDEAHERNLNIDFLLGLLKNIQNKRLEGGLNPLKIVVTSATVDVQKFAEFFGGNVPIISVSGRMYPVELLYDPIERGEFIYTKIAKLINNLNGSGDVLIFMPGEQEIFSTIRAIELLKIPKVKCLPLFSRLTMEEQQMIFAEHPGIRHVVVSTNIAETSVTVPGIKYVIDSGVARMTDFDFRTGIGSLEVRKISQASAIQRLGRSGRVQAGICIRLYDKEDFEERPKYTTPEIQRSDLASVVLHMILIGIKDVYHFDFIDPPDFDAFKNAFKTLHDLGALDNENNLTDLGIKMAHLPLEPRIACMLLAAEQYDTVNEVAIIASSLSVKDPFLRPLGDEEEADLAKRYFQRLASKGKRKYKYVKMRKGRRIVIKKVEDKSGRFESQELSSDLITFLIVWKKVMSIPDLESRVKYCEENYLNYKSIDEIDLIYHQLLDTLMQFAGEEFAKYLDNKKAVITAEKIDTDGILKAVASGLIQNLCELDGRMTYASRTANNIFVHPGSILFSKNPRWFVSAEIVETTKLYARNNSEIDPAWFEEIAPHLCTYKYGKMFLDQKTGQVMRPEEVYFKGHKIVDARLRPIQSNDKFSAFDFLIAEGLVKKTFANSLKFINENEKVRQELQTYVAKTGNKKFELSDIKLADWYMSVFSKFKFKPTSKQDLVNFVKDHGEKVLTLDINKFIGGDEILKLKKAYPDFVFINGKKYEVRYFYDHFKYPNGPALSLFALDLPSINESKLKKAFEVSPKLRPYLMVCSAEPFVSPTAASFDINELKKEFDAWHLRKAWKFARRKIEVTNLHSTDEVRRYFQYVLSEVEVGESLFFGDDQKALVKGYTGLNYEGRKFALLLYEDWAVALKNTLNVVKKLLELAAKKDLEISEFDLERLEKKYEKLFFGIDLKTRLKEILWQKIALSDAFKDFEKLKDQKYVAKVIFEKKENLAKLKLKLVKDYELLLDKALVLSEKHEGHTEELMQLKKQLDEGSF